MMVLALDSSTPTLSLALVRWREGRPEVLAERSEQHVAQHGQRLPAAIEALLAEAGRTLDDLGGCAVGIGPGSFTGLRIGLSTIKGLCYARRLPLAGASSLRAMALGVAQNAAPEALHCPLLDARRGEIYAGLFRCPQAEPLRPAAALRPEELLAWLAGTSGARVFGDGLHAQREALERSMAAAANLDLAAPRHPDAAQVARLAGPPETFKLEALLALEPRYVRLSSAEIKFPEGNFKPHAPEP